MAQNKCSGRAFSQIQKDLSQGLLAFRKPADFLINLVYNIPALAPVRVCIEVGIFSQLVEAATSGKGDVSAEELAEKLPWNSNERSSPKTAAISRRDFIVRMLRQVGTLGLIDEGAKPFTYCANDLTKEMADPAMAAGFLLVYDGIMGPKSGMTSMLYHAQQNSFRSPASALNGPYQHARDMVGTSGFDHWVHQEPEQLSRLSAFMSRVQKDRPHWTAWFPTEDLIPSSLKASPDRVFFVDVGGGLGHDLFALTAQYDTADLRFVLQDLPSVIEQGTTERGTKQNELDSRVSLSEHNFFLPQPVQGANYYYMHKIMHDWPDMECVSILSHLRDAMALDSTILVNELIVPDKGASSVHAGIDIVMLALHSGQERDEMTWRNLVDQVGGLKVDRFYQPPGGEGEGIVRIVRNG